MKSELYHYRIDIFLNQQKINILVKHLKLLNNITISLAKDFAMNKNEFQIHNNKDFIFFYQNHINITLKTFQYIKKFK